MGGLAIRVTIRLCLLKSPFVLQPLILQPALDALQAHEIGAPLAAVDTPVRLEFVIRRRWELDQVPAVRDPANLVQVGARRSGSSGGGLRRVAVQRGVDPNGVVIRLEVGELALEIPGTPEQHMVEKLPLHRPNEALDEGVRKGPCGTVLIAWVSKIRRFALHRCASNNGS